MTWIRALAAAVLSLFLPGAGHALIRDWMRALLFASVFTLTVALILPIEELSSAGSISAAIDIISAEPALSQFLLSFMLLFAALDAGFRAMALPVGPNAADGPTCPHCGRELDVTLEFCHWCTTRIEYREPGPEPEANAETESDLEAETETEAEVEPDPESNAESESESESESDPEAKREPKP